MEQLNDRIFEAKKELYLMLSKKQMCELTDNESDLMYFLVKDSKLQEYFDNLYN